MKTANRKDIFKLQALYYTYYTYITKPENFSAPPSLSKTIRDFLPAARRQAAASQFVTFTKSQIQPGKIPHSVLSSFEGIRKQECRTNSGTKIKKCGKKLKYSNWYPVSECYPCSFVLFSTLSSFGGSHFGYFFLHLELLGGSQ